MNKKQILLLVGGLVILAAAQVLNMVQIKASTEKAVTQALVSRNLVAARDLKVSLEQGLGLGKPLSLFNGTDRLFSSLRSRFPGIKDLAVTGTDLTGYAATPGFSVAEMVDVQSRPLFDSRMTDKNAGAFSFLVRDDQVLTALPVYFNNSDLKGLVWLSFDRQQIIDLVQPEEKAGWTILGVGLGISLGLYLLGFLIWILPSEDKKKGLKPLTRLSLLIVALLGAAVFSATLSAGFRLTPVLTETYRKNVEILAESQAQEWRRVLDWSVEPGRWRDAQKVLQALVRNTLEVEELRIEDQNGELLFAADRLGIYPSPEGNIPPAPTGTLDLRHPLEDSQGKTWGWLTGSLDQGFFDSLLLDRVLDALTVTLVSLIFSVELLLALGLATQLPAWTKPRKDTLGIPTDEAGIKVIRFTSFLFFFAEFLPMPFLPLYISDLFSRAPLELLQMSADAVKGLPFSAHLLGVLIAVPLVGALTTRFRLRSLFFSSGLLLVAGNLAAALVPDLTWLLAARLLSGLGYGGVLASSNGLIVHATERNTRTRGFAAWGAGFAAATICSVVLGGVLASYLGYRTGLLIAAGFSGLMGIFVLMMHPGEVVKREEGAPVKPKFTDLFAPFGDKNALLTLIFASLPVQLAFFGLFQYTLPLAMHEAGIAEANIGRILTVYGLLSLGAPLIARLSEHYKATRSFIILGNLITGLVLSAFFLSSGLWTIVIVVAAIGIGGLLFDTVSNAYLSMTKVSEKLGEARFLSVFLTWEKVFTLFIPIIVGSLMSTFGYFQSAALMGVVILAGTLIFAVAARTPANPDRRP